MNPESHTPKQPLITSEMIPKHASGSFTDEVAKSFEAGGIEVTESSEKLTIFDHGASVVVERSGKDGGAPTLEEGWKVDRYDEATDRIVVVSPDGVLEKKFKPEKLESIQPPFAAGESVVVSRNSYNAEGKRLPGGVLEADWKVKAVNVTEQTVLVASPDGTLEKTYTFDKLKSFQPEKSEQETNRSEYAGERLERVQHELAEVAVDRVGVAIVAERAPAEVAAIENKEVQKDPYDYLREVLPPVVRPEAAEPEGYDHLFADTKDTPWGHYNPNAQQAYQASETEEDKQRKYYDRFVTEENRESAVGTLTEAMKATPQLKAILESYNIEPASLAAVDAIRENPDVRFEVAKVLVQKLDRLTSVPNDMGWRINQNRSDNLKADQITGKKMMSRLHAVNMALKMIGGEFADRLEGKNDIQRDENDVVAIGQHRHAARETLMSYTA